MDGGFPNAGGAARQARIMDSEVEAKSVDIQFPLTDPVFQFTAVVAAALIVQMTLERSQVPGIIGLILLGMIIGPDGAGLLADEPVVDLLGSIGLLYIMFVAGLEIDLDTVKHHKREAAGFGLAAFGLSIVPAVAVGLWMDLGWMGALLLGAALSSHTLVAYPILERLDLVHRRPVVATIGGTLLTDTLSLVLLAIVIQQPGGGEDGGGALGWITPLLLLGVLAAVSLLAIPRLSERLLQQEQATRAEKALLLLAILLLLSVLADLIGTEDILGAFLAGVCLNRAVRRREELREHLEFAGRMLFIPFFFVETGVRLELAVFVETVETWYLVAALLAVVLFGKTTAAWLSGSLFGYSRAERAVVAGLSFPQAAATLAVITTGREAGLVEVMVVDAVIIVIFLTCLIGPLTTRFAGQRVAGVEGDGQHAHRPRRAPTTDLPD